MKEKVILAYSGGLDTTAIIPWLKENFDYEVICVCIDVGQESELDGLEEGQNSAAPQSYISRMLLTNSVMNISFLVYRQMQFMRINIFWALPWHAR